MFYVIASANINDYNIRFQSNEGIERVREREREREREKKKEGDREREREEIQKTRRTHEGSQTYIIVYIHKYRCAYRQTDTRT